MPWCPKCKSEYREGIKECADCKIPLMDELPPDSENPYSEENQMKQQVQQWALEDTEEFDGAEAEENAESDEIQPEHARLKAAGAPAKVYRDKRSTAEDFKSSGYTLIIVGILGLIALVLLELGVFPFSLAAPGKYITYLVMGAMFLIFVIMGFSSFKSFRKYAKEAETEDDLTSRIKKWAVENVTKESIVKRAALPEAMPEEVKYFKYFEMLKSAIKAEFGDIDVSYLEAVAEELYSELFEKND